MATITIRKSWPASGRLDLSDRGKTDAHRRETIMWKLGSGCGVKDISNIYPKDSPASNISWLEMPHRVGSSDNWRAVIDASSKDYSEYNYTISWVPKGTDPDPANPIKHYDPKIAVKPSGTFLPAMVILTSVAITAIFSMMFFSKKKT